MIQGEHWLKIIIIINLIINLMKILAIHSMSAASKKKGIAKIYIVICVCCLT